MSRATAMLEQTDGITRQLASIDQTLRPPKGASGSDSAAVMQQGSAAVALQAVSAARTRLKSFRDDKLARPLAGLQYRQYPRLRDELQTLGNMVTRPLNGPTDPEALRLRELSEETTALEGELQAIIMNEVAKVNQLLAGTPHVIAPVPRKPVP